VAHHLREDTETKGDGATDILVDISERRCVPLLLSSLLSDHVLPPSDGLTRFCCACAVQPGVCVRPGATAWTRGGLLPHAPPSGEARSLTFPRAPVRQSFFFIIIIIII
jgi:hypothetical protein